MKAISNFKHEFVNQYRKQRAARKRAALWREVKLRIAASLVIGLIAAGAAALFYSVVVWLFVLSV